MMTTYIVGRCPKSEEIVRRKALDLGSKAEDVAFAKGIVKDGLILGSEKAPVDEETKP